jgi:hypothetical protein
MPNDFEPSESEENAHAKLANLLEEMARIQARLKVISERITSLLPSIQTGEPLGDQAKGSHTQGDGKGDGAG